MGFFGPKWDKRFLQLAHHISAWSKDPSTKCGAVLVRPDRSVASIGFNGFPPGVKDTEERLLDKDFKYRMVRHAEVNCIDFCNDQDKSEYILYIWPPGLVPCTRCSAHVIAHEIRAVVYAESYENTSFIGRWQEDNKIAAQMLYEAGVEVYSVKVE